MDSSVSPKDEIWFSARVPSHFNWPLRGDWNFKFVVKFSSNVMAHGDVREGKWRGNWRMEWVASTLHTTSEHSVSSITTAERHNSAASSRLNWRPHRFKWTRPFRRKTKSGFLRGCHHISTDLYMSDFNETCILSTDFRGGGAKKLNVMKTAFVSATTKKKKT